MTVVTVVLGTQNPDKLKELQSLLKGTSIQVLSLKDFPGAPEVEETGKTFEANARKKARAYSRHTGCLTLADDSGLMVAILNDKPGVYSARFAGPGCSYADNNAKLLRLLKNTSEAKRKAKFVSVVAIYSAGRFVGVVKGECHGKIAHESRGKNGFGYDPVFIPKGFKKTFAELPRGVKNKISHRGKALRAAKMKVLQALL
ncbi:MAG: RdgB/HAM1 family non-canonical purine NTP pyrophosphatase [Candidatus Omnitrophica bacterium]|nr:RdgB/HAM1 family non-canonical purine NTP pyrophosphatase [Candidatus Omnitrophota bacterium]